MDYLMHQLFLKNYLSRQCNQNLDEIINLSFRNEIEFDQLIIEYPVNDVPKWIHISYSDNNRNQILIAERIGGKTVYKKADK